MGRVLKIIFLVFYISFNIGVLSAQNDILIQGVVVSADSGEPLRNIVILYDLVMKARSDVDGRFSFVIARDADLTFKSDQGMDYKETTINVDGRNNLTVMMQSLSQEIDAVTIVAKIRRKPLTVEPTELEVKGNYFHITPKLHIPYDAFTTDYRYVMQPTLVDVTTGRQARFRPLVMDGKNYDLVEHRHLNFGDTPDPLEQFVVPNTITPENEVYSYVDSIYVESKDLGNDFKVNCEFVLVTYNKFTRSKKDSVKHFEIAKGTVNPLRFFDYTMISPMQLDGSILKDDTDPYLAPRGADTMYIPVPELDMRGNKGVSKIEFEVGKTTLNLKIRANREAVDKIRSTLRDIQYNPYATLDSIKMVGYASPEGSYDMNLRLANLRTNEFMSVITSDIDPYNLARIKLEAYGVVESWSSVVELAEDDDPELAKKLQGFVDKYGNNLASLQWAFIKSAEYRTVIVPRYLPQLRRVTYEINYSILRPLSTNEVVTRYKRYGSDSLSRYEFYKLIVNESDSLRRETFIDEALTRFPDFTIMANYKAVNLLRRDSVNMDLLQPSFDGQYTPVAVRYNQAAMALKSRDFVLADSLLQDIPVNEMTQHFHQTISLLNGYYDDAYPYFEERGGLNEVLILLAMKENSRARSKMTELLKEYSNSSDARCHYIAAVCANRMEDLSMAIMHLNIALQLDPSLSEIAKVDGDILDIYELVEIQNMGGGK